MLNAIDVRGAARQAVAKITGRKVSDAEPLISSGLIDSLSILKLIAEVETSLGIVIPADNLQPDDFESVNEIADSVLRVVS